MNIPSWPIGFLFGIYAAEYVYRSFAIKERKYIYIGKALGRLLLSIIYFYFSFVPTDANIRAIWVRYGLVIFLFIDLFFVLQEHLMRKFIK